MVTSQATGSRYRLTTFNFQVSMLAAAIEHFDLALFFNLDFLFALEWISIN